MESLSNMADPVKQALQAMLSGMMEGLALDGKAVNDSRKEELMIELIPVFSQVGDFRKKLNDLDTIMSGHPDFGDLTEYIFDLLMLNFIASDASKMGEGYLDSEEWIKIEDDTTNRGTELLNLLIYISEAKDNGVEISLHDFLEEFLLADDELYQDEFFIYEPMIKNVALTDATIDELVSVAKKIESSELQELFLPVMAYFNQVVDENQKVEALKRSEYKRPLTLAIYRAIKAYEATDL